MLSEKGSAGGNSLFKPTVDAQPLYTLETSDILGPGPECRLLHDHVLRLQRT